jgi:hypothetical protein
MMIKSEKDEMRKAHILVWRPEGMDDAGELEINGRKI